MALVGRDLPVLAVRARRAVAVDLAVQGERDGRGEVVRVVRLEVNHRNTTDTVSKASAGTGPPDDDTRTVAAARRDAHRVAQCAPTCSVAKRDMGESTVWEEL